MVVGRRWKGIECRGRVWFRGGETPVLEVKRGRGTPRPGGVPRLVVGSVDGTMRSVDAEAITDLLDDHECVGISQGLGVLRGDLWICERGVVELDGSASCGFGFLALVAHCSISSVGCLLTLGL